MTERITTIQKPTQLSITQNKSALSITQRNEAVIIHKTKRGPQGPAGLGSSDLLPRVIALEEEDHLRFASLPALP